jgi:hypothetical protein
MPTILLLAACWISALEDHRPDLIGAIINEDGKPIAEATVFIYTAAPRKGTSVL